MFEEENTHKDQSATDLYQESQKSVIDKHPKAARHRKIALWFLLLLIVTSISLAAYIYTE